MAPTTTVPDFCFGDAVEMLHPNFLETQKIWYVLHFNDYRDVLTLSSNADGSGWMPSVDATMVKLHRRGNLFKHLFGLPLEFADLTEEISFWIRSGQIRTITNPVSLNLVWSLRQAVQAISSGRADAFQPFEGLYSPQQGLSKFYVYKATDPEIGRRLRQPSLRQLLSYQDALKA